MDEKMTPALAKPVWWSDKDVNELRRRMAHARECLAASGHASFKLCKLEESLEAWDRFKDAALVANYFGEVRSEACKPPAVAMALHGFCKAAGFPFIVLRHEVLEERAAASDVAIIEAFRETIRNRLGNAELPLVVKTLTMGVRVKGRKFFLLLGELGDVRLNRELETKLHQVTGLPAHALKHDLEINDPEFNPAQHLGLEPGNVGLFPYFLRGVEHLLFREEPSIDPSRLVALRFTPTDTLVLTKKACESAMAAWVSLIGREIRFFV